MITRGRPRPLLLAAAGLWLLFVAVNPGRNEMSDARTRLDVAREIWTEGRISLDPSRVTFRRYWIPREDGRLVSFYGLGQSLVFIPFDMAGAALSRVVHVSPDRREFVRWLPVGLGLLPLLGVLWWFLLTQILREAGLGADRSVPAAGVAILTTLAFFYVSNEQEEALVGCLMAAALWAALRWKRTHSFFDAAVSGVLAGFAVLIRFDAVLGFVPVGFLFAGAVRRGESRPRALESAGVAAGSFAVFAGAMFLYNRARFGSLFETGYQRFGLANLWKLEPRCLKTIFALLFGPGKGFFVLSPLLVVALLGISEFRRRLPLVFYGSAAGFGGALIFYSAYQGNSDGPWSWGTRYLAHFVTLWAIPLALAIELAGRRLALRRAVLALGILSAVIQLGSVFISQDLEYLQLRASRRYNRENWVVLMTSARRGQLYRRFGNIASWVTERPPAPPANLPPNGWMPEGSDSTKIEALQSCYTPNFWGPSFAKLFSGRARIAVLATWFACLSGAMILLTMAAIQLRGESP